MSFLAVLKDLIEPLRQPTKLSGLISSHTSQGVAVHHFNDTVATEHRLLPKLAPWSAPPTRGIGMTLMGSGSSGQLRHRFRLRCAMSVILQPSHAPDHFMHVLGPHRRLAADIDEKRRHAGHGVLPGQLRLLVDIDVDHLDALGFQPGQGGLSLLTGATPGSTEGNHLGRLAAVRIVVGNRREGRVRGGRFAAKNQDQGQNRTQQGEGKPNIVARRIESSS